jgi:hypothetical protein
VPARFAGKRGHAPLFAGRRGHSTFVLTLSTYADYIAEDELAAPKVGRGVADAKTVVPLQRNAN